MIDSINQGGLICHVKSDYANSIIQNTPLSPYTRHLILDFRNWRSFSSLPQPHHVTASHHSPGDKPQERGTAVRKNTGTNQNGRVKLNHLHMHQGPPILSIFHSSLCWARPSSQHPSNITSVYLVPNLHLLPP